ncbi:MAG: hypothetical protein AAF549_02035 [Pseudomonadota bacterium]
MIEAVNSVLSNASATRQVVEQQSTARSLAANPTRVQEAPAKTPYVSPYISFDRNFNRAVLQIRDSDTGDVLRQYPTQTQLRAYQTAQQYSERQERADIVTTGTNSDASVPQVNEVSAPSIDVASSVETEG